jgi:hypothetical protein
MPTLLCPVGSRNLRFLFPWWVVLIRGGPPMLGRPRVNPDKTLWAPVAEKT